MEETIFTKIINGEIPCHKIYEDDKTLAFLDIHPVQPGHTLVIPKRQVEFVWDLPSEDYQAVMATVQKVAKRLRAIMERPYVGEMVVGTDVPHAHVHLVPFDTADQLKPQLDVSAAPADSAVLSAIAARLAF